MFAHERETFGKLPAGVFGMAEVRYFRSRVGGPAGFDDPGIDKQRHDGVGEGAGGDLYPRQLSDATPEVDQLGGLRSHPLRHLLVVVGAEAAAAFGERYETLVSPGLLTGMGKNKEYLQVAQIPGAVATGETILGTRAGFPAAELAEPRVAGELAWVDVKGPRDKGLPLVGGELGRWGQHRFQNRVGDRSVGVCQELLEKRGNDIDNLTCGTGGVDGTGKGRVGAARVNRCPRSVRNTISGAVGRLMEVPEKGDCRHK